jgi:hypothetical protein
MWYRSGARRFSPLTVGLDERHKAIVREASLKCFGGI